MLNFIRHPWAVATTQLQNELGFQFRSSFEETLMEMWAEHHWKKDRR